ncbi:MAG: D-alanyl-D-alanine carboxypeptidase, partial [Chitinophagaceae bacterium]|nr:D-alanyl-D-alanine carboxypeptidase [Chitinophagaceae bacterium]
MQKLYELRHLFWISLLLLACSTTRRTQQMAAPLQQLLADSALVQAHVGVLVSTADEGRTIAAFQADKYFVPASNTKLFTLYAGLRFLGDSLPAAELAELAPGQLLLRSMGDPTFLHPDYTRQPLAEVLRRYPQVHWQNASLRTTPYGNGWSWNDYDATYMAPRSSMPMFGNVISFSAAAGQLRVQPAAARILVANADSRIDSGFDAQRRFDDAQFSILPGRNRRLSSTLYLPAEQAARLAAAHFGNLWRTASVPDYSGPWRRVYSQPTDSMLKPLMHRSDNFFAEQTLLMISQQLWGYMDEDRVIDSLLRTDLQGLPQPPRWVDGSGLSRYNLFSPADMVWLLQALRTRFGMSRLQALLATGNKGTLTNYYQAQEGKIFAKTGTLAGVVALSGYLYAASGKLLQFSVLV